MGHVSRYSPCRHMRMRETSNLTLPAHHGMAVLAQVGTFSVEFAYLSDILNDPSYIKMATRIIERLANMTTALPGLYPATVNIKADIQRDECKDSFDPNIVLIAPFDRTLGLRLYHGRAGRLVLRVSAQVLAVHGQARQAPLGNV